MYLNVSLTFVKRNKLLTKKPLVFYILISKFTKIIKVRGLGVEGGRTSMQKMLVHTRPPQLQG